MMHYNLSAPLNDPKNLGKFNYDVAKWYLFVANITEEVWVELKKVFEAVYAMNMNFQTESKYTKESSATEKDQGTQENTESVDSIKAFKIISASRSHFSSQSTQRYQLY